jgi:GNAT superfamily N-acetyltransferase
MSPVKSVAQVQAAIQQAKAGASAFCTNFFPVQSRLQTWIEHGELWSEAGDGSVILLRKDRDLWHCYFCAANTAMLEQHLPAIPLLQREPITLDLVGHESALADLLQVLAAAGFRNYARLLRLARTARPGEPASAGAPATVFLAGASDCEAILALLEVSFDRFADNLPTLYELRGAVESHQILVIKEQVLAAVLFFETQGFTSTVRFWAVAEAFRTRGFGSGLIRHYFAIHSAVRRFILWVTARNENALQKYAHYGYAPDGLVDHVLVNELIHS